MMKKREMKSKGARHTLLAGMVSVLLCCTLCLESTFAWYQDQVSASAKLRTGKIVSVLSDASGSELTSDIVFYEYDKATGELAENVATELKSGKTYRTGNMTLKNSGNITARYTVSVGESESSGVSSDAGTQTTDVLDALVFSMVTLDKDDREIITPCADFSRTLEQEGEFSFALQIDWADNGEGTATETQLENLQMCIQTMNQVGGFAQMLTYPIGQITINE